MNRGSEAELLAAAGRDQAGVPGVLVDPAPHERAVGQDRQVPLPGGVQGHLDQTGADALAAEPFVGLGIRSAAGGSQPTSVA